MKTITRKIVLPEWANFIAQDYIGNWYAYELAPVWTDAGWDAPDGECEIIFKGKITKPERKTLQRV